MSAFVFLVDGQEMVANRKVVCKQYAGREKKDIEVSKQFVAFWIALLIAPTFHVRIMFVPFCSLYIFGIN